MVTRMIERYFLKEFFMLKRYILFALISGFSINCFAGPLWHCIANNEKSAVWNQYGKTERDARSVVEKACIPFNKHQECPIVCFPPRIYWRCMSHDTLPAKPSKNAPQPKLGTWYWASFSKSVAINGARDACRHNSPYGGCYVDPKTCASS